MQKLFGAMQTLSLCFAAAPNKARLTCAFPAELLYYIFRSLHNLLSMNFAVAETLQKDSMPEVGQ